MSTTKTASTTLANLMKEASDKQAAVHKQVAAASTPYEGTGSVIVKIYIFGGAISCAFNINGVNYNYAGKCAAGGWATGTSTGTISCNVNPQSMIGDITFDFAASGSGTGITFYQHGVPVATYSGSGISGGAGAAGTGTWSQA